MTLQRLSSTTQMFLAAIIFAAATAAIPRISFAGTEPAESTTADRHDRAQQALDRQQSLFIENRGQWDPDAKFLLQSGGLNLWITSHGMVYDLFTIERNRQRSDAATASNIAGSSTTEQVRRGHIVRMTFEGRSFTTDVKGEQKQPGYYNYLIGNDPSRWTTNVPLYSVARIEHLYQGIDAVFYVDNGRPRYDLVIAAGADPSVVRMRLEGAGAVNVNADGDLVMATSMGTLEQRGLFAYQEVEGAKQQVPCSFVVSRKGEVCFAVGAYDRTRPLIVDPLAYSTFLGGNKNDVGNDITVDAAGNAYVTGYTDKATGAQIPYPTSAGAYQTTNNGNADVFVTKLNPAGSAIVYSTFIGGQNDDHGNAIAIDASGNAYITGYTLNVSAGTFYPTTAGAFQTVYNGGDEVFVTKLNTTGTALVYSTLLGGNSEDHGNGIAVDASGNAYVTGYTAKTVSAPFFPTTAGAFQTAYIDGDEVFVTKLNTTGSALIYSTYIAGSNRTRGNDIAIDASGNAYITGFSAFVGSPGIPYPTTAGAFQTVYTGSDEVFVTKLNSSGTSLLYSTFIGGSNSDQGNAIAIDASGNAYVTGITANVGGSGTAYPTTAGAYDQTYNGLDEVFVSKVNSTGSSLLYSTLIGSARSDVSNDIAVDASGNAYITGSTPFDAVDPYPTTSGAFDETHNGGSDVFVSKLSPGGNLLLYSTYIGGAGDDAGNGIALDAALNVYITGFSDEASPNYPTTAGAYATAHSTGTSTITDGFVTKLGLPLDFTLPVELTGFNLSASNHIVTVGWRTASEVNNMGFEVQRASEYDTLFRPIASYLTHSGLVGLGTNSSGKSYTLVDEVSAPGLYRYRLVDVSTDGIRTAHTYKSIRIEAEPDSPVELSGLRLLSIAPNPVNDELQVSFTLPKEMTVTMEFYTTDGRRIPVPIEGRTYVAGTHSEHITTSGLVAGVYMLRLEAGGHTRVQRFVVVR
jgi:hypothetical protein